jgi:inward rectifier potassium channel
MDTEKPLPKQNDDLGLGDRVVQENRTRFLNRDGSFNVHRKGVFKRGAFSPYHAILSMSWGRFYGLIIAAYLLVNIGFTVLYLLCGGSAFPTLQSLPAADRIGDIFFFSVHILTTIGESGLAPANLLSKILLALEAMTGLLGFALAAGLVFARFSNPAVKIHFSRRAVIAPYKDITGLMIRIVNGRSNELVDLKATLTVGMADEHGKRSFHQLALERDSILVFPLSWTIVHPITPDSPLFGMSMHELSKRSPEVVLAISAVDEDISRTVYARHSYIAEEISEGERFVNILERMNDGTIVVDPARIHETEKVEHVQPQLSDAVKKP